MPIIKNPKLIEAHAQKIYGCSNSEAVNLNEGKQLRAKNTAAQAFCLQKQSAKDRGIEWHFTFPQWLNLWKQSGKWELRGRGKGYCMARKGDTGPYSPQNVEIKSNSENIKESYINIPAIFRAPTGRIKTHCIRGHELGDSNRASNGDCRICDSMRRKQYAAKRKSVVLEANV